MLGILGAALGSALQLANSLVNRVKNKRNVRSNRRVRVFIINAIRDKRTCMPCRSRDGKKVKNPREDFGKVTKANGWGRNNKVPPFHPNCRCEVTVKYE
jgi:hypothetical protein